MAERTIKKAFAFKQQDGELPLFLISNQRGDCDVAAQRYYGEMNKYWYDNGRVIPITITQEAEQVPW